MGADRLIAVLMARANLRHPADQHLQRQHPVIDHRLGPVTNLERQARRQHRRITITTLIHLGAGQACAFDQQAQGLIKIEDGFHRLCQQIGLLSCGLATGDDLDGEFELAVTQPRIGVGLNG